MIVGMLGAKDAAGFLSPFAGLAAEVLAVPIASQTAGRSPQDVAAIAALAGIPATPIASLDDALALIASRRWPTPPQILICGSLCRCRRGAGEERRSSTLAERASRVSDAPTKTSIA
jgi:dihydrofolate synthase/folylpolyglutamate synthase